MCKRRLLDNAANLFLDKPGPLLSKHPGCGTGSGNIVVCEAASPRHSALNEFKRCQVQGILHLKSQRGRHIAHVEKVIVSLRGFDSGPPKLSFAPSCAWTSTHLPAPLRFAVLFLLPSSSHQALLLPLVFRWAEHLANLLKSIARVLR